MNPPLYLPLAVLFLGLAACHSPTATSETTGATTNPGSPDVAPIDCPLHKAGIEAKSLRPFEEVEQYIAFLERPDRATWQKPQAVIAALGLQGDETVTDVGAGSGYFSFPLAAALPEGLVRAVDIEPEMIRHIHHRVLEEKLGNLEVALATPEDPGVESDTDLVFVCDVLHHVSDPDAWLATLHDELRPGAKLALVEFKQGDLPAGPPAAMKIGRDRLVQLVVDAGFHLIEEQPDLLPYQMFLVFQRD